MEARNNLPSLSPEEMLSQTHDKAAVAFKFFDEKVGRYGKHAVYCFVEGYDAPYYSPRVAAYSDKEVEFIECGGKKGVIESFQYIASKPAYSVYKSLYFVDKDYDDNSAIPLEIFVTEFYSVENYYATDKAVRNSIRSLGQLDVRREEELENTMEWYEKWKIDFTEATKLFCAWYANTINNPDRHINDKKYKNSFPVKYAEFSSSGINRKSYSLSDLNNDYSLSVPVTQNEIDTILQSISSIGEIRGKYVLQLVEEFIEAVRLDSTRGKQYIKKPFSFEKNRATLLTRLSGCAETSNSLKTYLKNNL